jgi:hypothetical protein
MIRSIPTRVVHWRKEPYDVYVGRGSVYGNPFTFKDGTTAKFRVATREEAILRFEEWIQTKPGLLALVRKELRNKILGCWCSPAPCHGEVLARIANAGLE